VRAVADRRSGDAPLTVAFSAQASDPDGPTGEVTYLWDFGDGGANAFGRNAEYTYWEPGTYTATVTATDGHGDSGTAMIQIVVGDPPGNQPPDIRVAAAPRTGTAPLEVNFTSLATDPDGDRLTTPVWDFGDGGQLAGDSVTWRYTQPGTYTATARVRDPAGLQDTDSVQIVVAAPAASQAPQGSPPQALAPPDDGAVAPASEPQILAPSAMKARQAIRRGLRLKVSCEEACRARSVLRISGERVGASKRRTIGAGGSRTLVARLDRVVRRNLLAAMRQAGLKRVTMTAITTITTDDVTRAFPVKITLRR
jgi:PKD repeat protein